MLDKVLRAVSSLAETLTLGSILAALKQQCPTRVMGTDPPQEPLRTEKNLSNGGKKEFFLQGKRDLQIVPGYMFEVIFIQHDFGATQVWEESWGDAKMGIK